MDEIKAGLANYISIVSRSLSQTRQTEDRPKYIDHLAKAAVMFSLIQGGAKFSELEELLLQERQSYGRGYLSSTCGEAAETAFNEFVALIESKKL